MPFAGGKTRSALERVQDLSRTMGTPFLVGRMVASRALSTCWTTSSRSDCRRDRISKDAHTAARGNTPRCNRRRTPVANRDDSRRVDGRSETEALIPRLALVPLTRSASSGPPLIDPVALDLEVVATGGGGTRRTLQSVFYGVARLRAGPAAPT